MKVLVINGPNLNFLGIREKAIYGNKTYQDLENYLYQLGEKYHLNLEVIQTNHEGVIIDKIQDAYLKKTDAIIINPGAYTHYSYAIRDAIKSVNIPTVEVHLSDIMNREDFRKTSVIRDVCLKSYYGMGFESYLEAVKFIVGE